MQTPIPYIKSMILDWKVTRHIKGTSKKMAGQGTSVSSTYKQRIRLLELLTSKQQKLTRPGHHWESVSSTIFVAIWGVRAANTKLILVILPHHHHLEPDHSLHDAPVLVTLRSSLHVTTPTW
ncbi:hypothetical protein J6590_052357 [Homalodisca vitripennis]|nr:hypothetical protein J6590_052357 [Homalodisca vitripennis]